MVCMVHVVDHGREVIPGSIQLVPFIMYITEQPVGPILAYRQIGFLSKPEQMPGCLFHLWKFARIQINERQSEEQTSGAIKIGGWFSQGVVQFKLGNVFMPGELVCK